jgi:sugar phosphate isomerase/epimerase
MEICLSGLLFDHRDPDELAQAARRNGYAAVELRGTRNQLPPDAPVERAAQLAEILNGLPVVNIATHVGNFALLDAADTRAQTDLALKYIGWARQLDRASVRLWPGWIASNEADPTHWTRAAQALRRCAEAGATDGVRIAIEMHHGTLADCATGAMRLLDAIDHPAVGLVFDPANLMQTPAPFGPNALGPIWDRLLHVHVKDHAFAGAGEPGAYPFRDYLRHIGQWVPDMCLPRRRLGPAWYAKRLLGAGDVPWPAILRELNARGYAGTLIIESEHGPEMPAGNALATREFRTLRAWLDAPASA